MKTFPAEEKRRRVLSSITLCSLRSLRHFSRFRAWRGCSRSGEFRCSGGEVAPKLQDSQKRKQRRSGKSHAENNKDFGKIAGISGFAEAAGAAALGIGCWVLTACSFAHSAPASVGYPWEIRAIRARLSHPRRAQRLRDSVAPCEISGAPGAGRTGRPRSGSGSTSGRVLPPPLRGTPLPEGGKPSLKTRFRYLTKKTVAGEGVPGVRSKVRPGSVASPGKKCMRTLSSVTSSRKWPAPGPRKYSFSPALKKAMSAS